MTVQSGMHCNIPLLEAPPLLEQPVLCAACGRIFIKLLQLNGCTYSSVTPSAWLQACLQAGNA